MVKTMRVQSSQIVPRLTVWMVGYIMSFRGQGESLSLIHISEPTRPY